MACQKVYKPGSLAKPDCHMKVMASRNYKQGRDDIKVKYTKSYPYNLFTLQFTLVLKRCSSLISFEICISNLTSCMRVTTHAHTLKFTSSYNLTSILADCAAFIRFEEHKKN